MTKRILILVPQGFDPETLTLEQKKIFVQNVNPMPVSVVFNSKQIMDVLVSDDFNPSNILSNWLIIGISQWDGVSEYVTILQPLDIEVYKKYMPDGTGTECHRWAGWPEGGFTTAFNEGFKQ